MRGQCRLQRGTRSYTTCVLIRHAVSTSRDVLEISSPQDAVFSIDVARGGPQCAQHDGGHKATLQSPSCTTDHRRHPYLLMRHVSDRNGALLSANR